MIKSEFKNRVTIPFPTKEKFDSANQINFNNLSKIAKLNFEYKILNIFKYQI